MRIDYKYSLLSPAGSIYFIMVAFALQLFAAADSLPEADLSKRLEGFDGYMAQILKDWNDIYHLFVKVLPVDYRSALDRLKKEESKETEVVAMTEEVFG